MPEVNVKRQNKNVFYVIGIGSSAGGLKALEEFFDNCPHDTGFAFVIIQHLSPDYKSLMPELLSRHTKMSVKEAKEGDQVTPNRVYLIPGEKNIQIKNGKLELTTRPPSNHINFSIDIFFNSLAAEQKEKALAIVLSGTGSDGTKGAKAIKEIGGTVFVQTPDSSGFDGMPRSVINQGLADFVLEPKEMARELLDFISQPNYTLPLPANLHNNEESLNRILKIIKNHVGYDFFSYKKPTLLRRTAKRINITKSQTVENYIDYLHDNPNEKFVLTQEFLIGVTKFFRDYKAFEILEKEVIPKIINSKRKEEIIKIWVVACSTGEEAYSLTILIQQYLTAQKLDIEYKVFATDLDERAVEVATKGIYNENIESEVAPEILSKYFNKRDNKYQIHPSIRKNIIFSKHDILKNPPFNKMDLVSCRNMLIYMENNIQNKVLSSLHYALNLDGYLFLGSSENIGPLDKNFEEINSKWKIYKNIQTEPILNINRGNIWRVEKDGASRFQTIRSRSTLEEKISKSINKLLMDNMGAVSVCVDDNFEIIHASGKLKKYIQYPEEGYSNNLLKMLPDELNIPISTGVRKISMVSDETVEKEIKFVVQEKLKQLRVIISPFNIVSLNSRSFLITIIEESERKVTEKDKEVVVSQSAISSRDQMLELKEALNETRENLQATIEELETSNEEMQATNEELLASNEELQSTNEELQSLNEELHTVNAELQEKNAQLIELNSDVENLMKNISIGTIFLDRGFQIRKYTPAIRDHFHLRVEDVGRSISHFSGTIDGDYLIHNSKEVIKTLKPYREELQDSQGQWYTMEIFPYRSEEDLIQGVVINFIDINELKNAINKKEELNAFMNHLLMYSPSIIYIYDLEKKQNVYCSTNILEIAGYGESDINSSGKDMMKNIIHQDDIEKVNAHHDKLRTLEKGEILQIEYRLIHKKTKKDIWILSTDKAHDINDDGSVRTIMGSANMITKSKQMEFRLKESEERFRLAVNSNRSGLWEWSDLSTDRAWYSDEFYSMLGYSVKEVKNSFSSLVNIINPEHVTVFRAAMEDHVNNNAPFEEEIQLKTKNNEYIWFRVNGIMQYDHASQSIKKIVGTLVNINDRKESEQKMKELNVELERFAYLASHDLKEPLRTVTSFTKLFEEEYGNILDDDAKTYLNFIGSASSRMITLTEDLLAYSQLNNKSLKFRKIDLNNVLYQIKQDLNEIIKIKKAEVFSNELPSIVCDQLQLKQLFQNLISNSLKYVNRNEIPNIIIGYKGSNDYHEFFVKDNGIGIPQKHHETIFDVFKRLHGAEEYEGTGIGLANCKRIIDNHEGEIWVDSEEGRGSTFFFRIPKKLEKYAETN